MPGQTRARQGGAEFFLLQIPGPGMEGFRNRAKTIS